MKKPTVKQLEYFFRQIEEGKITREKLQIFLEKKERIETFKVTVLDEPLAKLIAAGNYDYVSGNITSENFSLDESQIGDFDLELVHLSKYEETGEVLAELDARNLEPARIGHLLGFGTKYPEIQREFPILALGSSWVAPRGRRGVPVLEGRGAKRGLGLPWCGYCWDDGCRFLALRK
ncbi:hypothetical protein ACFL2B_02135 [Patescibacteria group bacterium]